MTPWRREWQFTLVFLPGEFHGHRSLVGYVHRVTKSWTRLSRHISEMKLTSIQARDMLLCVQSKEQNQSNLRKGISCSWGKWHASCQISKQPSCLSQWIQNPCDVVPFQGLWRINKYIQETLPFCIFQEDLKQ